jgi:Zn-dependent protease with chaperone function
MFMRKLLIIMSILLIAGCSAHRANKAYDWPAESKKRIMPIIGAVAKCMNHTDGKILILETQSINAFMDTDGNIILTEGILYQPDSVLLVVIAHEFSHYKLNHPTKLKAVSYATTGAMMVVNWFVPGAGILNHAVNPAIVNNYSKSQELDADRMASEAVERCFHIPVSKQIEIMQQMKSISSSGGGFWDRHPSWDERIKNIASPR